MCLRRRCVRRKTARQLSRRHSRRFLLHQNKSPGSRPRKILIYKFFDQFEGIGDPEMQKIAGRLLAGEVVQPGSYSRKTIRTLAELDSKDFLLFQTLCRFVWMVGGFTPLVFDPNDPMYKDQGLDFRKCEELDAMGLLQFSSLGRARVGLGKNFSMVSYGPTPVVVELKEGADQDSHRAGHLLACWPAAVQAGERASGAGLPRICSSEVAYRRAHGDCVGSGGARFASKSA